MRDARIGVRITAARASAPSPRESGHTAGATAARRIVYGTWRHLPPWLQRRIVRAAVPAVTVGVCAVITDAQGRLLLAHHPYRSHPWGLPGGFARRGEQPPATLAREVREELGVAAQVGPLVAAEMSPGGGHLTLYYHATLLGHPQCAGDDVEIDAWRYVALSDIGALLGAPRPTWLAQIHAALAPASVPAA